METNVVRLKRTALWVSRALMFAAIGVLGVCLQAAADQAGKYGGAMHVVAIVGGILITVFMPVCFISLALALRRAANGVAEG